MSLSDCCMWMPPGLDAVQVQYALLAFLAVLILWGVMAWWVALVLDPCLRKQDTCMLFTWSLSFSTGRGAFPAYIQLSALIQRYLRCCTRTCCKARSPLCSATALMLSLCCPDASRDHSNTCEAHAHVWKSGHSIPRTGLRHALLIIRSLPLVTAHDSLLCFAPSGAEHVA